MTDFHSAYFAYELTRRRSLLGFAFDGNSQHVINTVSIITIHKMTVKQKSGSFKYRIKGVRR